jgi:hypothetical protein
MATGFCLASIEFADGSTATIVIREKVAAHFGIESDAPAFKTFRKRGYTYTKSSRLSGSSGELITVPASRYTRLQVLNGKGGRKVRIPTGRTTAMGCVQTYGITFPVKADYWEIGQWLARHCKRSKPQYFLTEAGKKRAVFDWSKLGQDSEEN